MNFKKRKYTKTTKEQQIIVLQEMYEKKDILFGKFAGCTATKQEISDGWKKVVSLALAYGLVNDSDEEKFRRVTWQNWRRNVMNKVDRMKRTGVGGAASKDLLDECDKLVLAIVGDEIVYGLDVSESDGRNNEVPEPVSCQPSTSAQAHAQREKVAPKTPVKKSKDPDEEQIMLTKKLLKINYYAKQLECRERELRLGINISKHTASLFVSSQSSDEEDD